jgi:predicted nuclease of predicted toxin-antitoxin system
MLALLLDEQISPLIAEQLSARQPSIAVQSLHRWQGGALLAKPDTQVLEAAAEAELTLVTYDLRTIPSLLIEWGAGGAAHSGVIFVDQQSISPNDFGRLTRAILQLWELERDAHWVNRIMFLEVA